MLYISSDHAGYKLKKHLLGYFKNELKKEITDLGPFEFTETDDYPDYAAALAREVVKEKNNLGILICGSGHGMCIAANKIKGARASIGYSIEGARMAKKDDDVNILCLAGSVLTDEHAAAIVKKFLETEFENIERRTRRIEKIAGMEK